MGLLSKQAPIKPKYTSLENEDLTVGEGFEAAGQFGMDVLSGIATPAMTAGQTIVDHATGVSLGEKKRSKAYRENEVDYQPTNKLAQEMSKTGKEAVAKGATAVMGFLKDPDNAWMFGYMPEGIDSVQKLWGMIPEEWQMSIGAGMDVAEVLLAGGAFNTVKQGSKLTRADIFPELKNTPTVAKATMSDIPTSVPASTPALISGASADIPRLPESRTQPVANIDELGYTSGIEEAIITLMNDPKTPKTINASHLLGKLTGKNSKVKDDEIEWSTYSDWLKEQGNKQVTLDEALRQAKDRAISLEVSTYDSLEKGTDTYRQYSAEGGSNYRELIFQFDTGSDAGEITTAGLKLKRYKLVAARDKLIEERSKLLDPRREAMVSNVIDDMDFTEEPELSYMEEMGFNDYSDSPAISEDGNALHEDALWSQMDAAAAKELPRNKRMIELDKEINTLTTAIGRSSWDTDRITYQSSHWPGKKNPLFHGRVTDREIGGGNSLALDEIQSDWHQGQGNVENRPYYRLAPDKMGPHIEKQIEQSQVAYDKSLLKSKDVTNHGQSLTDAEATLIETRDKALATLSNHQSQLKILNEEGYAYFAKDLRPNAPLKNKDKWMGAELNAMLYMAVKEGYDSVSWPNGKTQATLYNGLEPGDIEALEKMYDVTVPTMLSKMAKKMDKEAKVVFGKKSADSTPRPRRPEDIGAGDMDWEADESSSLNDLTPEVLPTYDAVNSAYSYIKITPKMKASILKGKPLFNDGGLVAGYKHGGLVDDEMEALNLGTPDDFTLSGGLPKAEEDDVGQGTYIDWEDGDTLTSASKLTGIPVDLLRDWNGGTDDVFAGESLRIPDDFELQDTVAPATYYDKDDQNFTEYGGTEEPAVATPSVATTPVEEALTEAVVAPEVDATLTGWSNLAGLESSSLHVDPIGIVTMGYGVVPDGGVTLNGAAINVKTGHGLTSTSVLDKVDTSKAYKTVNGVKYKREDYTSDELFSKAVYSGFYASAKASVTGFAELDDEHVEVIIDIGYNAGEGAFKWNDVDTLSSELQKDVDKRTAANLSKFTGNFAADGKFGGGVLRRRAIGANKVLGATDQIAYIEQGNDVAGTTTFYLKRSDKTTVRSWEVDTPKVNAYPTGQPILTIDGERKASFTAPIIATVDLTDWDNAIA